MTQGPPPGAPRSPDGQYWWDGAAWRPVPPPAPAAPAPQYAAPAPPAAQYGVPTQPAAQYGMPPQTPGYAPAPGYAAPGWPGAAPAVPRPPSPLAVGALVAGAGAVGWVAGAFMPWVSASAEGFTASKSGIDGGDGWFFVGFAVAVAALLAVALRGVARIWVGSLFLVAGLVGGGLTAFEVSDAHSKISDANAVSPGLASYGAGLWVLAAASAAVVIGSLVEIGRDRAASR